MTSTLFISLVICVPPSLWLFARLWNEENLIQRHWHAEMAKLHMKHGDAIEAMAHVEKAKKLQKHFIRWI